MSADMSEFCSLAFIVHNDASSSRQAGDMAGLVELCYVTTCYFFSLDESECEESSSITGVGPVLNLLFYVTGLHLYSFGYGDWY